MTRNQKLKMTKDKFLYKYNTNEKQLKAVKQCNEFIKFIDTPTIEMKKAVTLKLVDTLSSLNKFSNIIKI